MAKRGLIYSTACKYAVQAAVYLARHPEGATVPRIADDCSLMPYTLANVMRLLAARGILSSAKGVHGGFRLRRKPFRIRLADLVAAVDGAGAVAIRCSPLDGPRWRELRASIHAFLTRTTVARLARAADRGQIARAHATAE